VKVLDFGLARALAPESASIATSASPTITSPAMTQRGVILGTAPYMAPEQARGKSIDKRVDVWAFGCLLFEMLSGRRAFDGDDITDTIAAVIGQEPDWSALPPETPPPLRALIGLCLQKDRADRLRDLGDAKLLMAGAFGAASSAAPQPSQNVRTLAVATAAVLIAAVVAGAAGWFYGRRPAPAPPITKFQFAPPEGIFAPPFSLSPDGRHLAFSIFKESRNVLWIHSFESGESREIADMASTPPIWSPDSRAVAFASRGALKKVDLVGGSPEDICKLSAATTGGSWSSTGTILFDRTDGGIAMVPASGGEPRDVTVVDGGRAETRHARPTFLPDGRRFLYLRLSSVPGTSGIYVGSVDATPEAQPRDRVIATEHEPFLGTGPDGTSYVLYARGQALVAQRINPATLALVGEPVQVVAQVGTVVGTTTATMASVSQTGTLAYRTVSQAVGGTPTWVTRTGRDVGGLAGYADGPALFPRLSPDGRRVALVVGGDLWAYHTDGRPPVRLTFNGGKGPVYSPVWSPDARRIAYEPSGTGLNVTDSDGSRAEPETGSPPGHYHPHAWTHDGELVVTRVSPGTGWDILRLPPSASAKPAVLVETPAQEGFGGVALSADRRWLAYVSNTTATDEVYVRPFSDVGPAVRVSPRGGWEPVWAPSGRELFYRQGTTIMALTMTGTSLPTFSHPVPVFEYTFGLTLQPPSYDVAPDGRFIILRAPPAPPQPTEIMLNWTEMLPR
jgi:Tol biopolymer transport system component